MLASPARWSEVSLLSLGLFFGTAEYSTAQTTTPDPQHSSAAEKLENAQLPSVVQVCEEVWGEYGGVPVKISTGEGASVQIIRVGADLIECTVPLTKDRVRAALDNFSKSGKFLEETDLEPGRHRWQTSDGVVFLTQALLSESALVRTPEGLFRLTSKDTVEGNHERVTQARQARAEIVTQLDAWFTGADQRTFRLALADSLDSSRVHAIKESIAERIRSYARLPYLSGLQEVNLRLIDQVISGKIQGEKKAAQIQALEEIFPVPFHRLIAFSAVRDGEILRRGLIIKTLSERRSVIAGEITEGQQGMLFDREWKNLVAETTSGTLLLDLSSSKEVFDPQVRAIEKILLSHERQREIHTVGGIDSINARVEALVEELQQGLDLVRVRHKLTLEPQNTVRREQEIYEWETGGNSFLRRGSDENQITETWAAARKISEASKASDPGSRLIRSFDADSGTLTGESLWNLHGNLWNLEKYSTFKGDGSVEYCESVELGRCTFYDQQGRRIADLVHDDMHSAIQYRWIFSTTGEPVTTLPVEKLRRAGLTDEQYLNLLAKTLDSPERIHYFLELCMAYTSDGAVDTWQTPQQTVRRVDDGIMRGDCEDYAFLAREVLRRQGINAHVIYLPGHAECVWLERDTQRQYHAYSLGTFGYDRDGIVFRKSESHAPSGGFADSRSALQSLMKKYEKGGLGLSESFSYQVNPQSVQLAEFGNQIVRVPLHALVRD